MGAGFFPTYHNSVFQAEVKGITKSVKWLKLNNTRTQIKIFTDSQAAIEALSSTAANAGSR